MSDLNKIALKILSNGKGILAADESTGTMTKRLDAVNVKSSAWENQSAVKKEKSAGIKIECCENRIWNEAEERKGVLKKLLGDS